MCGAVSREQLLGAAWGNGGKIIIVYLKSMLYVKPEEGFVGIGPFVHQSEFLGPAPMPYSLD